MEGVIEGKKKLVGFLLSDFWRWTSLRAMTRSSRVKLAKFNSRHNCLLVGRGRSRTLPINAPCSARAPMMLSAGI